MAGAILICIALMFARLHQPVPAIVLPSPNGYDDFVQAAKIVVTNPFQNESAALSRAGVEQNIKALALVRKGLTKQCRVPIEYSIGPDRQDDGGVALTPNSNSNGKGDLLSNAP